jgi:hypothetical protein
VAARAGQLDLDRVRGRGERAGAHPDQAGRQLRVAVQREDRGDVLERAGRDHLRRPGRERLLGGLEDQPDPAGQLTALGELGQRETEAQHDRGVHVVAAGVRHVLHGRAVRHVLEVGQRQRVQVGPEGDHPVALTDVADQTVAFGQHLRLEAGHRELPGDQCGSFELVVRAFRMRVNMAPNRYQLRASGGEPAVELAGQGLGTGQRPGPLRLGPFGLRQSSSHVGFQFC